VAERKRETGYRFEVLFDASAKPLLQRVAGALGLEVAAYVRTVVLRQLADDLVTLAPVLEASGVPGLGPGDGYQQTGPGTGPSPVFGYPSPGPGTGPGTGPSPGTAIALLKSSGAALRAAAAAAPEAPESASGVPVQSRRAGTRSPVAEEEDRDLDEAVDWREHEYLAAGKTIASPARWREAVRAELAKDPEEVEAILDRKDRAEEARKPTIRPPGLDRV
jgi:hypothetical protein